MAATHVYKVVIYREGLISSALLGAAKVNEARFTRFLNDEAAWGWRVVTIEKDVRRMLLFFVREAYVVILERPAGRGGEERQAKPTVSAPA
ncbi:MAG: DUF4177 domain-containing protein [Pseudomonadota bacterium]